MAIHYHHVWSSKAKLLLQVSLITYQKTGDSRSQITAGLLMRLAYTNYKSYLSHSRIHAYEVDISY
jgi:hypothetical protein